jgi:transposase
MTRARDLHPNQGRLEEPDLRGALVRALAAEGDSYAVLGRKFGVTYQAVQAFAQRHRAEILAQAVQVPYWSADKRAAIDECAQLVAEVEQLSAGLAPASVAVPDVASKLAQLKTTAEQLGRFNARRPRRVCA